MNKLKINLEKISDCDCRKIGKSFLKEEYIIGIIDNFINELYKLNCYRFNVTFYKEIWSHDIDLQFIFCYIIEQVPNIIKLIEKGKNFDLDLLEQGWERNIEFVYKNGQYIANCNIYPNFRIPKWKEELHDKKYLLDMFTKLIKDFISVAFKCTPELKTNKIFNSSFKDFI